jgi:hypothetical protein
MGGLKRFNNEVGEETIHRFEEIARRIQKPLIEHVRDCKQEFRPMAIRLMVLGEDAVSAKPRIVVLCPAQIAKQVEKFFDRRLISDICRPADRRLIQFDVVVLGQTLSMKALEIIRDPYNGELFLEAPTQSFCGFGVQVPASNGIHYASMGGFLAISTSELNNEVFVLGMTTGHVFGNDCKAGEAKAYHSKSRAGNIAVDYIVRGVSSDRDWALLKTSATCNLLAIAPASRSYALPCVQQRKHTH